MILMIVIIIGTSVFFYNMYNYYHPKLLYVVKDNLNVFETAKDKSLNDREVQKSLKASEIGVFKIDNKTYTLTEIFSWRNINRESDKIVTFEYFRGSGGDNAALSYGIVYSPDESTLKKGLTHTWWNTIEYHCIPISEHWYLVRRSYTDLIHDMFFSGK